MKNKYLTLAATLVVSLLLLSGCAIPFIQNPVSNTVNESTVDLDSIPEFTDDSYVVLDNNVPSFPEEDFKEESFEEYSELDELGRCGSAYACIGQDLMPTEDRGSIGQVKPSGWKTVKYDNVDGKYLYNRCHLIGYQLTAENSNEKNLITGTRYMNVEGMLPFENMVADYIKETDHHVLYRVTPVYKDDNLVASGVQMEAESVEDDGQGICFNVYVYNNQPDITINYANGDSWLKEKDNQADTAISDNDAVRMDVYILNCNTKKFHRPECASVKDIKGKNKERYEGNKETLIEQGYEPCALCRP